MTDDPGIAHDQASAGISADLRRREFGAFLRSRRERLTPDQVGLPNGGRRRTPGLRREEVAQLASIGVTWYTWLEQGRNINASVDVLEAVARSLQLDRSERVHLFTLAGATPDAGSADESYAVSAPVLAILDQLVPFPAAVQNARFDLLAYNQAYGRMIIDLDELPPEERNTIWLLSTYPEYRSAVVGWEAGLARAVATFRSAYGEHVGDPAWKYLVRRLLDASPEFRAGWQRHDVAVPAQGFKRLVNARVGLLQFDYTSLWVCQRRDIRMLTYTPSDDETRRRLELLRVPDPRPAQVG